MAELANVIAIFCASTFFSNMAIRWLAIEELMLKMIANDIRTPIAIVFIYTPIQRALIDAGVNRLPRAKLRAGAFHEAAIKMSPLINLTSLSVLTMNE